MLACRGRCLAAACSLDAGHCGVGPARRATQCGNAAGRQRAGKLSVANKAVGPQALEFEVQPVRCPVGGLPSRSGG